MAISENGPNGYHSGKIGNVVYYKLNGKNVVRTIGVTTKPPSISQLHARMATKKSSQIIGRLLDFINTGFRPGAVAADDNPFNQAIKYNKKNIVKGNYPNLEIAYDQLIVSKGTLKAAENWKVIQTEVGLQFEWDTHPEMAWPEATDQVMMLAYFPALDRVVYSLYGNSRLSGSAVLDISPGLQMEYMETYLSFVAANRKQVADSIYTGNFNREAPERLQLNA